MVFSYEVGRSTNAVRLYVQANIAPVMEPEISAAKPPIAKAERELTGAAVNSEMNIWEGPTGTMMVATQQRANSRASVMAPDAANRTADIRFIMLNSLHILNDHDSITGVAKLELDQGAMGFDSQNF